MRISITGFGRMGRLTAIKGSLACDDRVLEILFWLFGHFSIDSLAARRYRGRPFSGQPFAPLQLPAQHLKKV